MKEMFEECDIIEKLDLIKRRIDFLRTFFPVFTEAREFVKDYKDSSDAETKKRVDCINNDSIKSVAVSINDLRNMSQDLSYLREQACRSGRIEEPEIFNALKETGELIFTATAELGAAVCIKIDFRHNEN